jgi:type III restriction enzyme
MANRRSRRGAGDARKVPKPRKTKNKPEQGKLALGDKEGLTTTEQEYNPTPIINEIRSLVLDHVAN